MIPHLLLTNVSASLETIWTTLIKFSAHWLRSTKDATLSRQRQHCHHCHHPFTFPHTHHQLHHNKHLHWHLLQLSHQRQVVLHANTCTQIFALHQWHQLKRSRNWSGMTTCSQLGIQNLWLCARGISSNHVGHPWVSSMCMHPRCITWSWDTGHLG